MTDIPIIFSGPMVRALIREPWAQDVYQIFQLLLTEKEMLGTVGNWTSNLARSRP